MHRCLARAETLSLTNSRSPTCRGVWTTHVVVADDDDVSFAERYQLERQEAWAALRPAGECCDSVGDCCMLRSVRIVQK